MTTPRHHTKTVLIGFLIVGNLIWTGLAVALIWTNATRPSPLIESCIAAEIKRTP